MNPRHLLTHRYLVKCNLGAFLAHIHVLVEGTIRVVCLFLDCRAELEQRLRHRLVRCAQNIDKPKDRKGQHHSERGFVLKEQEHNTRSRMCFVVLGKECNRLSLFASPTGPANTMHIIFNS